jgi:hypothetical protein
MMIIIIIIIIIIIKNIKENGKKKDAWTNPM